MSAFVISNDQMNLTIEALKMAGWPREFADLNSPRICQALGEKLFDMNRQAVAQRYSDDVNLIMDGLDWKYKITLPSRLQAYKALSLFMYQCSEGNIPETDLYKTVQTARYHLADMIIRALPAYETACMSA